nr:MAG TPA: hypothetical protein [Caudoviricetes sp.]
MESFLFYRYDDSELTPSPLKLRAKQALGILKKFQLIDFIEFSLKKRRFFSSFLRLFWCLFSFPFAKLPQARCFWSITGKYCIFI